MECKYSNSDDADKVVTMVNITRGFGRVKRITHEQHYGLGTLKPLASVSIRVSLIGFKS